MTDRPDIFVQTRFNGRKTVALKGPDSVPVPQEGEVLLRVQFCGICGSDIHQYMGKWKQTQHTPGHEFCGIVEQVGPGVEELHCEDRVVVEPLVDSCGQCELCVSGRRHLCSSAAVLTQVRDGGLATYAVVPEHCLHPIPSDMDMKTSVLIEPLAVALHAIRCAGDISGLSAGVVGGGTVGLLCAGACVQKGVSNVSIITGHAHQKHAASSLGAAAVTRAELTDEMQASCDVVFDCVGGRGEAMKNCMTLLRSGGTIVAAGGYTGLTGVDMGAVSERELQIRGSFLYSGKGCDSDMARAMELLPRMGAERLITHSFPLTKVAEAFKVASDKGNSLAVKVVVECGLKKGDLRAW